MKNNKVTVIKEYLENEPYAKNVVKIMKGSKVLEVKKKCTLNGQCNQGDINAIKITSIKEEEENHKREFGCLMLNLEIPKWDELLNIIDDNDVYDLPSYGKETEPHVTLLFGFHDGISSEEIIDLCSRFKTPINIKVLNISAFKNKDFDVLKFDIESEELNNINKILSLYPHTNTYKGNYHPHITISYLNPNTSDKYCKVFEKPLEITGDEFNYSMTNGSNEVFKNKAPINQINHGKGDQKYINDFNIDQIIKGIDVEKEHTDSISKALEIVLDHLTEKDDYYTILDKSGLID